MRNLRFLFFALFSIVRLMSLLICFHVLTSLRNAGWKDLGFHWAIRLLRNYHRIRQQRLDALRVPLRLVRNFGIPIPHVRWYG